MPQEIIFKPKYKRGMILGFVCIFIMALVVWLLPGDNDWRTYVARIGLPLFLLWMPFITVKEIVFSDQIITKRFFLPPKIFNYEDIQEISIAIYFSHGHINLRPMKNADEFMRLLTSRLKERSFNFHMLNNDRVERMMKSMNYLAIVIVPIGIVVGAYYIYQNVKGFSLKDAMVFAAILVPIWLLHKLLSKIFSG